MEPDRANEGNVVSPFSNLPRDGSHTPMQVANSVIAEDATPTTPVTSPVTGTSPVTLNIPENATAIYLVHDATSQTSTFTFNGQGGTFGLVASQTQTLPCAGEAFQTIVITPGASGTYIYFAFELV
jgi:hypothetical protein